MSNYGSNRTWNDETDAELRRMAGERMSARDIGAILGKSRNAVIGRAARAGIILLNGQRTNKGARPAHAKPVARRIPAQKPVAIVKMEPRPVPVRTQPARRLTLMELEWQDCRYIVEGDGEHALFCALPVKPGHSWCPHHFNLVVANAPFLLEAAE